MKIGSFDTDERVFIVAEIGNNHEGDFDLAVAMLKAAARSGADAVKFQTFRTQDYVSPADPARTARLRKYELSCEQFGELARIAHEEHVIFISTPLDLASVRCLDPLVPAYKIASGDNTFWPLIEAIAATGKPIIMSAGLSELAELRHGKQLIEGVWQKRGVTKAELAVLHCVTSYPTPPEQANIQAIATMHRALGGTIGYSDHTIGTDACILAVAMGARIIEKHFTLDKQLSDFRDHQLSAEPAELADLVARVRAAEAMMGDGERTPRPCERELEAMVRRSIVAARDLPIGTRVSMDDLSWVRPATGLSPGNESKIVGRRLRRKIVQGYPIMLDDLED
jgi:N,N'-diacetyllegionaminate synthase